MFVVLGNFKSVPYHLPDFMFPLNLYLLPTDEKERSELLGGFPVVPCYFALTGKYLGLMLIQCLSDVVQRDMQSSIGCPVLWTQIALLVNVIDEGWFMLRKIW